MKITVYVRSHRIIQGIQKHQNIPSHMGGGCSQHSTYLVDNAVEDRLLEPESMEVAQAARRLAQTPGIELEYIDTAFWFDWGQALLAGVWRTPVVVIDGVRFSGLPNCLRALELQAARSKPVPGALKA